LTKERRMEVKVEILEGDIKWIFLNGSMDIPGTEKVDLQLTTLTSLEKTYAIIDLTDVSFMGSMAIGLLFRCARTIRLRGGNMVLYNPQPGVADVLDKTRVEAILPITSDLTDAMKKVMEPTKVNRFA
jgi:anti-anti-sigma factor